MLLYNYIWFCFVYELFKVVFNVVLRFIIVLLSFLNFDGWMEIWLYGIVFLGKLNGLECFFVVVFLFCWGCVMFIVFFFEFLLLVVGVYGFFIVVFFKFLVVVECFFLFWICMVCFGIYLRFDFLELEYLLFEFIFLFVFKIFFFVMFLIGLDLFVSCIEYILLLRYFIILYGVEY